MKDKKKLSGQQVGYSLGLVALLFLILNSVSGLVWGVSIAIVILIVNFIFYLVGELGIALCIVGIMIISTLLSAINMYIRVDINLMSIISSYKDLYIYIKHHSREFEPLEFYNISLNTYFKYYYSWFIAFLIPSIVSMLQVLAMFKLVKTKSLRDLKKGKVLEKKDKIEQEKLYDLCRNLVNPLRDEIGIDVNDGSIVDLPDKIINTGVLVLGKTGEGKTEFLKNIYYRTIKKGLPLIIVNAKPDINLERFLKKTCDAVGTEFYSFGCMTHDNYDFLNNGRHTAITDKIMTLNHVWDNTYFKNRANTYIQNAIYIRQNINIGEKLTLENFIDLFEPEHIEKFVIQYIERFEPSNCSAKSKDIEPSDLFDLNIEEKVVESESNIDLKDIDSIKINHPDFDSKILRCYKHLSEFSKEELNGLKDIFTILYTSEMSDSLASGLACKKTFSLTEVIKNKSVVYFSLNVLEYPQFAPLVGKVVMNDYKGILSNRNEKEYNEPIVFVGDEVSAFASENLLNISNMGRGFGNHPVLGTQGLSDFDKVSPTFKEQIMCNITALVAHTVPDPKTAEYISEWVGTQQTIIATAKQDESNEDTGSLRQGAEFIVNPNELKRDLGGGKAFFIDNKRKIAKKIQVALVNETENSEELKGNKTDFFKKINKLFRR